jgi:hypothetical protein
MGFLALIVSTLLPLYLIFQLHQESNIYTSGILQEDFGTSKELILKIPIALPYATDWNENIESEGLFQYEGKFYTVVSKRYQSDTLYVSYLENSNARDIFNMLSDHFEAGSTGERDKNRDPSGRWIFKLLRSDYFHQKAFGFLMNPELTFLYKKSEHISSFSICYSAPYLGVTTPPPDQA